MTISMKPGTMAPATRCLSALILCAAFATGSAACRADDGIVDVKSLPRLAGAVEEPERAISQMAVYSVPGLMPANITATRKLLADDGWTPYVDPLAEGNGDGLLFKRAGEGLIVSFRKAGNNLERSRVTYLATRINVDLPLPEAARDILFNGNRPYLRCVTTRPIETTRDEIVSRLATSGWTGLTVADIAERWPGAKPDAINEDGVRAYFVNAGRAYQKPIMMTLQRRDGGTSVEIKVAPFAQPQDLEAGDDSYGLPTPKFIVHTARTDGAARRELKATLAAEVGPVLAFYRRELGKRGWTEQSKGAAITPEAVTLAFTSAECTGLLKLGHQYDLTTVGFVLQVSDAVLAAREKAKRDESAKFLRDAEATARMAIAASDAQRAATTAAPNSDATLRTLDGGIAPVPLPETADKIQFDGADGHLEFSSSSSVKALAAFHRATMKPLGWKETPSVINNPNMVVLDFAKAKQTISFTIMQLGAQAKVTADGSGLKREVAKSVTADVALEADEDSGLPVPKQHTLSAPGSWKAQGSTSPFRRELDASVPAELGAVLAFYRRELTKRQWKEEAQGAVIKADKVMLAFTAPDGPAVLKLDRRNGETSVNLALKNPTEAAKAGIMPAPGQAKLMFGNMGDVEAAITIHAKTIKIAPGVGGPKTPNGPTLELPPGKYKVALKIAGRPDRSSDLDIAANDSWGLMVTPRGVMPMQLY
ncbi:MAG: hypothetical protein JWP84_1693 [Tardiphaga sp.]|nr:hypothetical protein [Tardiphaga sp.]